MSVLIVGSIALDEVKTPLASRSNLLGGSASYAALSASFFQPVHLVGIVGTDFPKSHIDTFRARNVDLEGLQIVEGATFRWSGEYHWDMNTRDTLSVALNVFENFTPTLPETYRRSEIILLANIAPALQAHVLDQAASPRFVIADTMDLWIHIAKPALLDLLKRVNMLILNDSEARELAEEASLIRCGSKIRSMGPAYVAIKKGEHGCLLFGPQGIFSCPAYPLEDLVDPTGAGDTFAGGVAGYLASLKNGEVSFEAIRKAVVYGSVLASYNVESFSLERLKELVPKDIDSRFHIFQELSRI